MFFGRLFVLSATCAAALASATPTKRQATIGQVIPDASIPSTCKASCAIVQELAALDPTSFSSLKTICTNTTVSSFESCLQCVVKTSPQALTDNQVAQIQQVVDTVTTACKVSGSPVSSLNIASATASANPNSKNGAMGMGVGKTGGALIGLAAVLAVVA